MSQITMPACKRCTMEFSCDHVIIEIDHYCDPRHRPDCTPREELGIKGVRCSDCCSKEAMKYLQRHLKLVCEREGARGKVGTARFAEELLKKHLELVLEFAEASKQKQTLTMWAFGGMIQETAKEFREVLAQI